MTEVSGYQVGRGKPPKEMQFKKGQSGNPKGKPKRKPSVARMFAEELTAKVRITENGKRITVTKLQLIFKQATNKAIAGNCKQLVLLEKLQPMLDKLIKDSVRGEIQKVDTSKMTLDELHKAFSLAVANSRPIEDY